MIFTRLFRNIKKQDWFAVCLELVIVILGIYLGLQAADWQARVEAEKIEKQLLSRLQEDLKILETENLEVIASIEKQINRFDATIKFVKDPKSWKLGIDEWQSQLQPLMGYPDPVIEFPVYEEIVATAQMKILKSSQLRQALTRFKAGLRNTSEVNDAFLESYTPAYQFVFDNLTDLREFPERFKSADEIDRVQMVRSLYSMRNTVRLVRYITNKNVESAAAIGKELAAIRLQAE